MTKINPQSAKLIYTSYTQFVRQIIKNFRIGTVCLILMAIIPAMLVGNIITVEALPDTFNPSLVLDERDMFGLPLAFSSPGSIRQFLESKGSLLANLYVNVGFEPDDSIVNPTTFAEKPSYLQPLYTVQPLAGTQMLVSDLIWNLAREDMGSGCSLAFKEVCIDNRSQPLNPAFLLALIQKESGLVYGANSKKPVNSPEVQFLLDRVVGYYCFENPDRSKSCYDENPNWRFFKGFFRQLYYANRLLRSWERRCALDEKYLFRSNGLYYGIGRTIRISNQDVYLANGITCSLYIYTPHISAQLLFYNVMKEIGSDKEIIQIYNLKEGEVLQEVFKPCVNCP